jgi:tetratricopeptide (TPR) repeat protein
MISHAEHNRFKRWRLPVVLLILATTLAAGGLLTHRIGTSPTPEVPEIQTEGLDPEVAFALTVARNKVKENPHSAEAWGYLSKVLLANQVTREASVCLRQTENMDDTNPRWPFYLALASLDTNTDEAIACFRRAVERCDRFEPEIAVPRLLLATYLIQEGGNEEAGEVLRVARAKEPGSTQALYLSALLLANRNDLRGSVALLRLLSDNVATRQKACTKLAQLHHRLGDSKAAQTWEKLARSFPEDVPWPDPYGAELSQWAVGRETRFKSVKRLQDQGRFSDAVAMLNQMIENNESGLSRAYLALGNNLVHLARGPEAERAYEEALRLSPDDAETHNRLALVRLFQGELRENKFGDHEGAKAHYRRALESARNAIRINPILPEAQMTLGQILILLGERQEGILALRAALRSRPEMYNAHLLLGETLIKDGVLVEGRQHLQDALRFADGNDDRAKKALELFERIHGKSPVPGTVKPIP